MKKKIMNCCLFGAPAGLALWMVFTVLVSCVRGNGEYYVPYYLIRVYGTELNAVIAQCVSAMLIGMTWSAASLIYLETDWSLLKQTVINFVACTVPALVIAYAMHWMPRSADGLAQYLRLFVVLYLLNWIIQYRGMRKRVQQMNEKLNELNEG